MPETQQNATIQSKPVIFIGAPVGEQEQVLINTLAAATKETHEVVVMSSPAYHFNLHQFKQAELNAGLTQQAQDILADPKVIEEQKMRAYGCRNAYMLYNGLNPETDQLIGSFMEYNLRNALMIHAKQTFSHSEITKMLEAFQMYGFVHHVQGKEWRFTLEATEKVLDDLHDLANLKDQLQKAEEAVKDLKLQIKAKQLKIKANEKATKPRKKAASAIKSVQSDLSDGQPDNSTEQDQ